MSAETLNVSRASGINCGPGAKGTFGGEERFGKRSLEPGVCSPEGNKFYGKSADKMISMGMNMCEGRGLDESVSCTLGIGDRPKVETGWKTVGPGSYETVGALSASKSRSPLDGSDYCHTTIKKRLPSGWSKGGTPSPGPKYNIRDDDPTETLPGWSPEGVHRRGGIKYHKQKLSHGDRNYHPEDKNPKIGPGSYYDDFKSIASSHSSPNLRGTSASPLALEATGGTKRCVKSTFGEANRWPKPKVNASPPGDLYYAHNKFLTQDDYMNNARSCSMGVSGKCDFSNPYHADTNAVSPHSYKPQQAYSVCGKTSAIDAFAERHTSPVHAHAKNLAKNRSQSLASLPPSRPRKAAAAGPSDASP